MICPTQTAVGSTPTKLAVAPSFHREVIVDFLCVLAARVCAQPVARPAAGKMLTVRYRSSVCKCPPVSADDLLFSSCMHVVVCYFNYIAFRYQKVFCIL